MCCKQVRQSLGIQWRSVRHAGLVRSSERKHLPNSLALGCQTGLSHQRSVQGVSRNAFKLRNRSVSIPPSFYAQHYRSNPLTGFASLCASPHLPQQYRHCRSESTGFCKTKSASTCITTSRQGVVPCDSQPLLPSQKIARLLFNHSHTSSDRQHWSTEADDRQDLGFATVLT